MEDYPFRWITKMSHLRIPVDHLINLVDTRRPYLCLLRRCPRPHLEAIMKLNLIVAFHRYVNVCYKVLHECNALITKYYLYQQSITIFLIF